MKTPGKPFRVGIVGPCTAGKSTLISRLKEHGIELRHIAQEHSYVQTMWQRISNPDWLIYLDVSYSESLKRKHLNWTMDEYQEQVRRLAHARQHASFYLQTDPLSPDEVAQKVIAFLTEIGVWKSDD